MTFIEIDISDKIIRIKCTVCSKFFLKSQDELMVGGIIKCNYCNHEHFLMKINK